MAFRSPQMPNFGGWHSIFRIRDRIRNLLVVEAEQLAVFIPVAFGAGIAGWFLLPTQNHRHALVALCLGAGMLILAMHRRFAETGLLARSCLFAALLMAAGTANMEWRSHRVAVTPLDGPWYGVLQARIEQRTELPARKTVRLVLEPLGESAAGFPERVRVNLDDSKNSPDLLPGAIIEARARLMPPSPPAVPGGYDFARMAWFSGLGASGTVLDKPRLLKESETDHSFAVWRQMLSAHIQRQIEGGAGAIAATLATGDRGAIGEADAEAMRQSGLAHLLSISGLHVSAVIAACWIIVLRGLSLSPRLALHWPLPLIAAAAAGLGGIAYTLLTGAEVPTIRACSAAMLVLLAMALGRDPFSMRLIAAGAMLVLVLWPETLLGPSFQLSFAAVTSIVALHQLSGIRAWSAPDERSWIVRLRRSLGLLLLTGLIVELVLTPIALFHFHKAGLYGALANLVAIPLTTLVIMPLEAAALVLDLLGMGAPLWWLCGIALNLLLGLAHWVSSAPGAVVQVAPISNGLFALAVVAGLWLMLLNTRLRLLGLVPLSAFWIGVILLDSPDLLITGDGRAFALRTENGQLVLPSDKLGDYTRSILAEHMATKGQPLAIGDWHSARCSAEFCSFKIENQGRIAHVLAARSGEQVPERALAAACRRADIVISGRFLPRSCAPRWFKADRNLLGQTGGLSIDLAAHRVTSVAELSRGHGWFRPVTTSPASQPQR